jgi:D-tyrosyl-tRNA(Tyr) deacylase
MRVVLQRVSRAAVRVDGRIVGEIGRGFLVLAGFTAGDTDATVAWMAEKVAGLRVFPDAAGKMNRSLDEIGGAALVVSQFTLYGVAEPLYERLAGALAARGIPVARGVFGAVMAVELVNDGPVTLLLER